MSALASLWPASLALACLLVLASTHVSAKTDRPILVFAAASLTSALQQAAQSYEDQTGRQVTVSAAGSSTLARQILHGAPADIYISANSDWMDLLQARGLIRADSRSDLLGNRLVMIARNPDLAAIALDRDTDLSALLGPTGRLAMAQVNAVPAGIYGRAALRHFGLWQDVEARVAQADNVRAALALVASGAAPLGIVYATDAQEEPRVHVIADIPPSSHPTVAYPAAILTSARSAHAPEFMAFLKGDTAGSLFADHGFIAGTRR